MTDVSFLLLLAGVVLLAPTAYAAKIGAPWVPTRQRSIERTFDELEISSSDTVVDLGAGNGKVLAAASRRGATAIGYELSPVMWLVAWLRTWGQKKTTVKFKNFYRETLPKETTVIFVFLIPQTMPRLKEYLATQQLPNLKYVASYAFQFKDVPQLTTFREPNCAPVYLYDSKQL